MFHVADREGAKVLDKKMFYELKVPGRPDFKTRAWRVAKDDNGDDLSCEAFFYQKVMNFGHQELRVLGASQSARSSAFKALEGASHMRLTGVHHEYFSFLNGIFNWQTGRWYPDGEGLAAHIKVGGFHPYNFDPYEDCKGDFLTGSWYDIPTPALDRILDHQQFSEEVKRTVYALFIGRMMTSCGQQDTIPWPEWLDSSIDSRSDKGGPLRTHTEVFSLAYGHSGTGKSELTKVLMYMFNDNLDIVGQLQNQSNSGFPIQHLIRSKLVISTEMDKKFDLPPTLFNQVCS